MTWIDGVLAVPTIGISINMPLSIVLNLNHHLSKFFDNIAAKHKKWKVNQKKESACEINADDYTYKIARNRMSIGFNYQVEEEKLPGAFPVVTFPDVQMYSDLIASTEAEFMELLTIFDGIKGIDLNFIGIVATIELDHDNLPPGVSRLMTHLSKPWGTDLSEFQVRLTARIHEGEGFFERCHHHVEYNEDKKEAGFKLVLDWQRVYNEPSSLSSNSFRTKFRECLDRALGYFEKIGEGDLIYE